jgi:hypothetical protein
VHRRLGRLGGFATGGDELNSSTVKSVEPQPDRGLPGALSVDAADWGSITVTPDPLGGMRVTLENSKLRCQYGVTDMPGSGLEAFIKELIFKEANENQAGAMLDELGMSADEGRGPITKAEVTYVGPDRMTVRMESPARTARFHGPRWSRRSHLSRQPDSADGLHQYGVNVVDWTSPGAPTTGTPVSQAPRSGSEDTRSPGPVLACCRKDGRCRWLNYWVIIAGVYNPANGRGVARVMPVADTSVMKHMGEYRGIEWFPHVEWSPPYASKGRRRPFTGYLYLVTGGAEEILSIGKRIADGELPVKRAAQ